MASRLMTMPGFAKTDKQSAGDILESAGARLKP